MNYRNLIVGTLATVATTLPLHSKAEIGEIAVAGSEEIVVTGYVYEGSKDTGVFHTSILPYGMVFLPAAIGRDIDGSFGQQAPDTDSLGALTFKIMAGDDSDGTLPFVAKIIYDAMQAAGSTDPGAYNDNAMNVANTPGEKILPNRLVDGRGTELKRQDLDNVLYVDGRGTELKRQDLSGGSFIASITGCQSCN